MKILRVVTISASEFESTVCTFEQHTIDMNIIKNKAEYLVTYFMYQLTAKIEGTLTATIKIVQNPNAPSAVYLLCNLIKWGYTSGIIIE